MKILYFASVRQKLDLSEESLTLPEETCTLAGLMALLAARQGAWQEVFSAPGHLKAAVNQTYAGATTPVCDSDEVAFFPPVTGG